MNALLPIMDVCNIDARLEALDWEFPKLRRHDIDAEWQRLVADKPKLFNGRVLLQHRGEIRDGVFHAGYFETDYADFLCWQRFGNPGRPMRNGFAMAALQTRDGAFLLGEMAAHTTNAGKIYFAAGTPDRNDVTDDGRVDLAGSVMRELEEETGLASHEVAVGQGWAVVMDAVRVAFMRPVRIDLPAVEARALVRDRLARQQDAELADIVIIRSASECDQDRMPVFMQRYLRHALAQPG
ncbi:MAG: NUDIX hydrolase [Beijerinckiaceae bacterium]